MNTPHAWGPGNIPAGKRSNNKGIIVLCGLTGAGKTTTLNFLFNRKDLIKTEDGSCSKTSTIVEYNSTIDVDGVPCDLRIFDTPGFGDTTDAKNNPKIRDAQFIATFHELLNRHEDLKACYPTTVLFVIKFDDDITTNGTSNFIQMLQALDTMLANSRLIDKGTPNIIFVLTHIMSERNVSLRHDPSPRVRVIESLVKSFTKIPTPINVVMAENKPEAHNLASHNGFYLLPNGQYYPENLFKKIQTVAVKGRDVIGETIIRTAFKFPENISISQLREEKLLPADHFYVRKCQNILLSTEFQILNTEMSNKIEEIWNSINEAHKKSFATSLYILQKTFNRHEIKSVEDIPKKNPDILKILRDLPINPPVSHVLKELGISGPELTPTQVGHFYNIFQDFVSGICPFQWDAIEMSSIGFRAPKNLDIEAVSESLTSFEIFEKLEHFKQARLQNLKLASDLLKLDLVNPQERPGLNLIIPSSNPKAISGILETKIFHVRIKEPELTQEFIRALGRLPLRFVENESGPWQTFFLMYGTHVIKSINAGGSIEIVASRIDDAATATRAASINDVARVMKKIVGKIGTFQALRLEAEAPGWEFSIRVTGGDNTLAVPTVQHIIGQGRNFYQQWKKTLHDHPAVLNSEIGLAPIWHHVQGQRAGELRKAYKHLFCVPPENSNGGNSVNNDNDQIKNCPASRVKIPAPEDVDDGSGRKIGWMERFRRMIIGNR